MLFRSRDLHIDLDIVSPENHRSNGLAEVYVRMLNTHFAQLPEEQQKKWVQAMPKIQYALAHTVCHDNHQSPMEMLLGRIPRNAYQVYQTPILAKANDTNTRMLALRNRQKLRYEKEIHKDEPKRQYNIKPKTFEAGDWVRMRSEYPHGQAQQRGVPVKWIFRWDEKGTIVGPIPGHPDQYLVRKDSTGRTVKRSGKTLSKIPIPNQQEVIDVQECNIAFEDEHRDYEFQEMEVNLLSM